MSQIAIKIVGMVGEEEVNETFPMLFLFFQQYLVHSQYLNITHQEDKQKDPTMSGFEPSNITYFSGLT